MPAFRPPARDEIPPEERWDLTPLFPDPEAWEKEFQRLEAAREGYAAHRGRIGTSAETLSAALEFDLEFSRRLQRLAAYARLAADEDLSRSAAVGRLRRVLDAAARAAADSSFIIPEIQAIPPERMETLLKDESLSGFRFYLKKIVRCRPHTRNEEVESVLARVSILEEAPGEIFSQLTDVDFDFGSIRDEKGEETAVTPGNFIRLQMSRERRVRRESFHALYEQYRRHRHGLAASLAAGVGSDRFRAGVRAYPSSLAAALFPDAVPESVYRNLIAEIRDGLGALHGTVELRRRALGLDRLRPWDAYAPLVDPPEFRMEYPEAVEAVVAALAPLGKEYVEVLRQGLLEGWVDRRESRGKRSGAYSLAAYDAPPFILLNYDPASVSSVFTLAHEAGHALHSWFSNRAQPFQYHSYSLVAAEVASTLNEILLGDSLRRRFREDRSLTAYLLSRQIDDIRATLHRQTMFAEFEMEIHRLAEAGEALTLETMTEAYRALLADYWGEGLELGELLPLEFLRIPHFYRAFYVYKYATGIAAALALAGPILAGESGAAARYVEFLGLGGSRFPLDELRAAGVDLNQAEPVRAAVEHFRNLSVRLEKVLFPD